MHVHRHYTMKDKDLQGFLSSFLSSLVYKQYHKVIFYNNTYFTVVNILQKYIFYSNKYFTIIHILQEFLITEVCLLIFMRGGLPCSIPEYLHVCIVL